MGEHYDIGGGRERYMADRKMMQEKDVSKTDFDKAMSAANEKQVGGKHYRSSYQHWDLVLDFGLHYLEGCATKYVTRRKGNRGEDIGKAIHYLEKLTEELIERMFEVRGDGRLRVASAGEREVRLKDYSLANGLTFREHVIMKMIVCNMDYAGAIGHMKELQKEL